MTYSREYIAKIVASILSLAVVILPMLGINLLPEQIQGTSEALVGVITFGLWIYTMIRQKNKESLTPLGGIKLGGKRYMSEK